MSWVEACRHGQGLKQPASQDRGVMPLAARPRPGLQPHSACASGYARVHARMRACMHACMHVCMCACAYHVESGEFILKVVLRSNLLMLLFTWFSLRQR